MRSFFKDVHHISSSQLPSIPSTLTTFVNYCDSKRLEGQNARTIERALEATRYVKKGVNPKAAIQTAWESYLLVSH